MQTQGAFLSSLEKEGEWELWNGTRTSSQTWVQNEVNIHKLKKRCINWTKNDAWTKSWETHSHGSLDPIFGRSHHFPLYNIFHKWWWGLHQGVKISQNSQDYKTHNFVGSSFLHMDFDLETYKCKFTSFWKELSNVILHILIGDMSTLL